MKSDVSRLVLHVDVYAGDEVADAVRDLAVTASRLGVWCEAMVTGIRVRASPNDNPDVLARNYEAARERKASFVSANVIPRGVAG